MSTQRDFIQVQKIEPPFIHRPDRTLLVHQVYPVPLEPITVSYCSKFVKAYIGCKSVFSVMYFSNCANVGFCKWTFQFENRFHVLYCSKLTAVAGQGGPWGCEPRAEPSGQND